MNDENFRSPSGNQMDSNPYLPIKVMRTRISEGFSSAGTGRTSPQERMILGVSYPWERSMGREHRSGLPT